MVEMVDARRGEEIKEERHDMFSNLLDAAHDNPDGSVSISEDELIGKCRCIALTKKSHAFQGNMFILLLAGHEVRSPPFASGIQCLSLPFTADVGPCTLLRVRLTGPLPR